MLNVICINREDYLALTLEKVYTVFGFNGDAYLVVNDKGIHHFYPNRLFKKAKGEQPKPLIGLIPRKVYWEKLNQHRRQDIIAAMHRYMEAKLPIPVEWCKELIDLVTADKSS